MAREYTDEIQTAIDEARAHLREHGWGVIPSAVSEELCAQTIDHMWDWLEGLGTGIDRNDSATWTASNWPLNIHGIIQHYGIGQTDFVWKIREKVARYFRVLWGEQDVISSYDGACIMRPPEESRAAFHSDKRTWLHLDESLKTMQEARAAGYEMEGGAACVQGLVTLEEVGEGDGTTRILDGSHRYFEEFCGGLNKMPAKDWYKLNEEELAFFHAKGCEDTRIDSWKGAPIPKGSLILWDSRLVHCNGAPIKGRPNAGRWRYVVYTCMTPRRFATPKALEKRRKAYEAGRMTSHWPHKPSLFPAKPRTYGRDISVRLPQAQSIDDAPRKRRRLI